MTLTWERLRCRCRVVAASASRGIAGGDRFGNGGVLGGGGREPLRVVGGQPADPDQVHAQAAHRLGQVGVGNRRIDGCVEPAHELVVGVAAGVAAVDQLRGLEQLEPELLEGRGVAALGGQRRRLSFEGFAQFEQLVDVLQRNIGDDDAAAARRRRQSFCGQPAQGLPEGSARDAEPLRLLHFREHRPGQEAPFDDVVAQCRVGPVAGAHPCLLRWLTIISVYTEGSFAQQYAPNIRQITSVCVYKEPCACHRPGLAWASSQCRGRDAFHGYQELSGQLCTEPGGAG